MPELDQPYDFKSHNKYGFILPRSYYYYDTPDGKDLVKKLGYILTTFGKAGVLHGGIMALRGYPEPKTNAEGWLRVVEYTKPWVITPSLFAISSYFATNIREKDDELNYAIGGLVAGTYMGVWYKSVVSGCYHSVFFGIIGAVYKYMLLRDYEFMGGIVPMNFKVNTVRSLKGMNFSVMDEYPRQWYPAEEIREKNITLPQGKVTFKTNLI